MLQNELTSEVSAGTISSSDESALSSALDGIDSQLQSDFSSSSTPPSPADMKSTINNLIEQQVQSGALTNGQASELQNLFANAFANGPGGAGGPPPGGFGPPSGTSSNGGSSQTGNVTIAEIILSGGTNSSTGTTNSGADGTSSSSSSSSNNSSSSSNSSSSATNLLDQFLQLLQQSTGATTNYSADGQANTAISALVFNYQA
jgi:hypothetical protein